MTTNIGSEGRLTRSQIVEMLRFASRSMDENSVRHKEAQSVAIKIRYYVDRGWTTFSQDRNRQRAFAQIIDQFVQAYPHIHIEQHVSRQRSAGGYITDLNQIIDTGFADVAWINNEDYAYYTKQGYLLDLTPYISDAEEAAFFNWATQGLRQVNGTLSALWQTTDTPLFYYRTDLIPEPPRTWSDLKRLGRDFKAKHPDKHAFMYPLTHWVQINGGMFMAMGGRYVDDDGRPIFAEGENRDILRQMFTFFVSLIEEDLIPADSGLHNHHTKMAMVFKHKVAGYAGNSNSHIKHLQYAFSPEEFARWSAVALPHPDGVKDGNYVVGGWMIAPLSSGDPVRESAAIQFALAITGREGIRIANEVTGNLPTRPDIIESSDYYSRNRFFTVALDALNRGGVVLPMVPIFPMIGDALADAITAATTFRLSVDEAIDQARYRVMQQYDEMREAK